MKEIILAAGTGSRLHSITQAVSKQLLPVYDKPMVHYPLSVLMLAGINDILTITTPHDVEKFKRLLGDDSEFRISLTYEIQAEPNGLAEAFIIGESFIGDDNVALILGDNLFYGQGFTPLLVQTVQKIESEGGATIFGYYVKDPERFGVVEFDSSYNVLSLEEKPKQPKSSYAATGLYFYDNDVIAIAKEVKPSDRGELEITSLNNMYLKQKKLSVELLGRGFAWLDTGTQQSLLDASSFIHIIEQRQGLKVACLEEIAFNKKWITAEQLLQQANKLKKSTYGDYLKALYEDRQ